MESSWNVDSDRATRSEKSRSIRETRDRDGKYTVGSGAESGGSGPIFAVLTVLDGALRLLNRSLRARMRWKAAVAYFPVNVVKCCEISANVVKKRKML